MSEDFRLERKWKVAVAYQLAHACLEWHNAPDKSLLTVRVLILKGFIARDLEWLDPTLKSKLKSN
jgi:hypothetical protein